MSFKTSLTLTALICCSLSVFGCRNGDPEDKYELKSPCVANDVIDGKTSSSPCVRRPINLYNIS